MAGGLNADERAARRRADRAPDRAQLVVQRRPHDQARARAAEEVPPVTESWEQGETIVRVGDRDRRRRVRGHRLLRPEPRRGLDVARLVGCRHALDAGDRPPADVDLALPARVLASQQRPVAAGPAAGVHVPRAQADRRALVLPFFAAARRRSGCWSRSCWTRASAMIMTALIAVLAAAVNGTRSRSRRTSSRRDRRHRRGPARRPAERCSCRPASPSSPSTRWSC